MTEWTNETAEWYAERYGEYATNRLTVAALPLWPEACVVDVGCGTGAALRHAAAIVTDGSLIGVDPVPRMVEIAREKTATHPAAARIEFRLGSAESLPVEADAADVVFAFDSIDHWHDVNAGLTEIRRVLKPGGWLAIVKDGGVPGASTARTRRLDDLRRAGFTVAAAQDISADGVHFSLWQCKATDPQGFSVFGYADSGGACPECNEGPDHNAATGQAPLSAISGPFWRQSRQKGPKI